MYDFSGTRVVGVKRVGAVAAGLLDRGFAIFFINSYTRSGLVEKISPQNCPTGPTQK